MIYLAVFCELPELVSLRQGLGTRLEVGEPVGPAHQLAVLEQGEGTGPSTWIAITADVYGHPDDDAQAQAAVKLSAALDG